MDDPAFRELLVRWFQWACFCPVFRMHGERSPWYEREQEYIGDVRQLTSGQSNEVWSFGDEVYEILRKYLFVRERMRPYIREVMRAAHEHGDPIMRPLFYGFPADKAAWSVEDAYLFGADVLVAPVLEAGARMRDVYLPAGADWVDAATGAEYTGGQTVRMDAPLDTMPVLIRKGSGVRVYSDD